MEPDSGGNFAGINQVTQYHQAYKDALVILRSWDDEDEASLLRLFAIFSARIKPLVDSVDPGWHNCGALG